MTSKQETWNCDKNSLFKTTIYRETLLEFLEHFEIHTDARKVQLGAAISQNNKPIMFWSTKLNAAQINYTTT